MEKKERQQRIVAVDYKKLNQYLAENDSLFGLTPNLASDVGSKGRKHFRQPIRIVVDYQTLGRSMTDHIRNISEGGLFIESRHKLVPEHPLTMTFLHPHTQRPVKINGEIMWVGPNGAGVKFTNGLELE